MTETIEWEKLTDEDIHKIMQIAERAVAGIPDINMQDLVLDISAIHISGCPIDLDKWMAADNLNFYLDIGGIQRHIDRNTGQLTGCFVPRYAINNT